MNHAALETVLGSIERLGESLAGQECAPIERAIEHLSAALATLRQVGMWHDGEALRQVAAQALAATEAARGRVNVLRDASGRRLDALGALRPAGAFGGLAYDRSGRQPRLPARHWPKNWG